MKLFDSPFKDDKKFVTSYVAQLSRDFIQSCDELLVQLFYDRIFKLIVMESASESKAIDDINRKNAFNILINMMQSKTHRMKLAKTGCLKSVFDHVWK